MKELFLDKSGAEVNAAGELIDPKGEPILNKGKKPRKSEIHSRYKISRFAGERSIEMAFHVQHVLQSQIVKAQGGMFDMLSPEDRASVTEESGMSNEIAQKYAGSMLGVQGDVLKNLDPSAMFQLVKLLFADGILVNNVPGRDALNSHFVENKSHVLPVLKAVIKENDFLDMDLTILLN